MIHRLDLGTSGIMVIALNKEISRSLNRQFSERTVKKTYTALLSGKLNNNSGKINLPIAKGDFPFQKICFETGKSALTEYQNLGYETLQHNGQSHLVTRVLYTPYTGRTHQLRIHSQQFGHPIIGCDLYSNVSLGVNTQEMADRLMLHATRLEFNHPISNERIIAECACTF